MENTLLKKQKFAYDAINQISEGKQKKYKSFIENFGMMVSRNGLISAMAFTKSKNTDLYTQIQNWLHKDHYALGFDDKDLLENLVNTDSFKLLVLTDEVNNLSDVLKEFAKALL